MQLVTLIGDLVGSRGVADRTGVQAGLLRALAEVNAQVPARQPLEPTVGDEFQGAYDDLGGALHAALLVRLRLLPLVDTRYGVGIGAVTVFAAGRAPLSQDGPGWWAARDAIEQLHAREGRRASARGIRTWCVDRSEASDQRPTVAAMVNALLLCRDETVGAMSPRARRLLLGWLEGRTQQELAAQEGISQSAVSQALTRSGAYAVRDAHEVLRGALG